MNRLKSGFLLLKQDVRDLRCAILGIAAYYAAVHFAFGQFCPSVILLGLPCPGCGMTRALALALTGHFSEAWRLQPLIYGWMFLALWFAVNRYLRGKKRSRLFGACLAVLILALLGIYGWRLLHGFPETIVSGSYSQSPCGSLRKMLH